MTEQESLDLEELHKNMNNLRSNISSYFVSLKRATIQDLHTQGYGTLAQKTTIENARMTALWNYVQYCENKTEKLIEKHLKKYPD